MKFVFIFLLCISQMVSISQPIFEFGGGAGMKTTYSYYFENGQKRIFVDHRLNLQFNFYIPINNRNSIEISSNRGPNTVGFSDPRMSSLYRQELGIWGIGLNHHKPISKNLTFDINFLFSLFCPSTSIWRHSNYEMHDVFFGWREDMHLNRNDNKRLNRLWAKNKLLKLQYG